MNNKPSKQKYFIDNINVIKIHVYIIDFIMPIYGF